MVKAPNKTEPKAKPTAPKAKAKAEVVEEQFAKADAKGEPVVTPESRAAGVGF